MPPRLYRTPTRVGWRPLTRACLEHRCADPQPNQKNCDFENSPLVEEVIVSRLLCRANRSEWISTDAMRLATPSLPHENRCRKTLAIRRHQQPSKLKRLFFSDAPEKRNSGAGRELNARRSNVPCGTRKARPPLLSFNIAANPFVSRDDFDPQSLEAPM